jgi:poly(A) polymerase
MGVTQKPHLHADWIDEHARQIVEKLQKGGFQTYLVGGCVRDLLVGIHPKDFDIATNAIPQQVKKNVPYSFIIGKRFRLVLVRRGEKQFEVATFRRGSNEEDVTDGEELPFGDNFFGTPQEDAIRRDFTINGLFYDPIKDELLDYSNGLKDIDDRLIRIIGEPNARLIEDPIRIFRALRLSHKLNFTIEPELRKAMSDQAGELLKSALPRRREEILKILRLDEPDRAFYELYDLGILQFILPSLKNVFSSAESQQIFFEYLKQRHRFVVDPADPAQLFALFILAYVRATESNPFNITELEESESMLRLMREELGMFKTEQFDTWKWLSLPKRLHDVEYFKRKGERRQSAFLLNEHIPMALNWSRADYLLNPADLHYWESHLQKKSRG